MENLENNINDLLCQKEELIAKGQFKKAQEVIEKINDIQAFQQIFDAIQKAQMFDQEIQQLDNEHAQILLEFDQAWEDLLQIENDRIKEAEDTMFELHYQEMEQLKEQLALEYQPTIKFSAEMLQKQNLYANMIKQGQYAQADSIQKQLEELTRLETLKWQKQSSDKTNYRLNQLTKRQINDLNALRLKLQGQLSQFILNRDQQKQLLQQKLQINRSELENKQNIEYNKLNSLTNRSIQKINKYLI